MPILKRTYTQSWVNRIQNRLIRNLYLDLGGDQRDSIFLAGSGRSGTTWASDIINYRSEYRYVFEPFYPDRVDLCKGFKPRQYLRPGERSERFVGPARTILTGEIRNGWTDRFHKRFVARKRLIKDIRANLLLRWIFENFPGMPIILLLRHPCAVIESKIKLGWRPELGVLLEQEELMEDFLAPFEETLLHARTDFEKHLLIWCVENYVPLRQFAPAEIHISFYENLSEEPRDEVGRLFAFLGKEFDERVLARMKEPSSLSRPESAVLTGRRPSTTWMRQISGAQLDKTAEILALFGLDEIYHAHDPMPNPAYRESREGSTW